MADTPHIPVELSLLESTGPIGKVGRPELLYTFQAIHLPGTPIDDGKACVVVRDQVTGSWREYTQETTLEQARELLHQLHSLGIPERNPEVAGVPDTSDFWTHLLLRVTVNQRVIALDIHLRHHIKSRPSATPRPPGPR